MILQLDQVPKVSFYPCGLYVGIFPSLDWWGMTDEEYSSELCFAAAPSSHALILIAFLQRPSELPESWRQFTSLITLASALASLATSSSILPEICVCDFSIAIIFQLRSWERKERDWGILLFALTSFCYLSYWKVIWNSSETNAEAMTLAQRAAELLFPLSFATSSAFKKGIKTTTCP